MKFQTMPPPHLLYALVVFTKCQTMQEAAKLLGITQPALSKQLNEAESYFDYDLFTMVGRKKTLTKQGAQLTNNLAKKFDEIHQTVKLNRLNSENTKAIQLKIAARQEILHRVIKVPFEGAIHFMEMGSDEMAMSLKNKSIDLAITQNPPNSYELSQQLAFTDQFCIAVSRHLFSKKKGFDEIKSVLPNLPFVSYSAHPAIYKSVLSKELYPMHISRTFSNWYGIIDIINSQPGWSIVPTSYIKENSNHFWTYDLRESKPISFYFTYLKELNHYTWFKKLIQNLKSQF